MATVGIKVLINFTARRPHTNTANTVLKDLTKTFSVSPQLSCLFTDAMIWL